MVHQVLGFVTSPQPTGFFIVASRVVSPIGKPPCPMQHQRSKMVDCLSANPPYIHTSYGLHSYVLRVRHRPIMTLRRATNTFMESVITLNRRINTRHRSVITLSRSANTFIGSAMTLIRPILTFIGFAFTFIGSARTFIEPAFTVIRPARMLIGSAITFNKSIISVECDIRVTAAGFGPGLRFRYTASTGDSHCLRPDNPNTVAVYSCGDVIPLK